MEQMEQLPFYRGGICRIIAKKQKAIFREMRDNTMQDPIYDQGSRLIFHVDVNSAFLSWSALKALEEDPSGMDLRTIPSAVGGDVKLRKGVITAKSIPAKEYGIRTGEPVVTALQKCPGLVLVRGDFQTYRMYSKKLIELLKNYSDKLEQVSIDEAYLDMTDAMNEMIKAEKPASGIETVISDQENGIQDDVSMEQTEHLREVRKNEKEIISLAERLKREVREKLGFTVNVGISTNKLLAKMASDREKPDKVHTIFPWEIPDKLWPLPVGELYGCGHATASRLQEMGVRTIGDLALLGRMLLISQLGDSLGAYIYAASMGLGSDEVRTSREDAKSVSNEWTTSVDVDASNFTAEAIPLLHVLAGSVAERLIKDGVYASTIGVVVKTDTFARKSRQTRLRESTNDESLIYQTAEQLLTQLCFGDHGSSGLFDQGAGLRLIGVKAEHLDKGEYRQISLFDYSKSLEEERRRKKKEESLQAMIEKIQLRYGQEAVHLGTGKERDMERGSK